MAGADSRRRARATRQKKIGACKARGFWIGIQMRYPPGSPSRRERQGLTDIYEGGGKRVKCSRNVNANGERVSDAQPGRLQHRGQRAMCAAKHRRGSESALKGYVHYLLPEISLTLHELRLTFLIIPHLSAFVKLKCDVNRFARFLSKFLLQDSDSCRARSSDLDPIAIRRSQPTEEERAGLALACSKPCSGFP